ncbi:hydroxyproline dehydrogenase [Ditylenchus destructor]|nr:hydroxyproline dehydrogenase [Ditylenchus destructor]
MHMICRHSGTGNFLTRSLIENKRPLKRNLIRTFTSPSNGLKTNAPVATTTTHSRLNNDDLLKERAREIDLCYNKLDLSFENAKEALKSKSNKDLIRALLVFRMCTVDFLVQNNQRLLQLLRSITGKTLFSRILKATFYGHFVAGETQEEVNLPILFTKYNTKSNTKVQSD